MNPAVVAALQGLGLDVGEFVDAISSAIDELSVKQENAELTQKLSDGLVKLNADDAAAATAMFDSYTKVLITEAQGQDKVQRSWRPHLAYGLGATMILSALAMLVVFPLIGVKPEPEAWGALQILIGVFSAVIGANVASRGYEKMRVTDALADKLGNPLPRETKVDAKAYARKVKALKKAGLSPDQIVSVLEGEE